MRSLVVLSLAISASATLTKRSPRLVGRQSSSCYSTEKICGSLCILQSYTCCPDRLGGCPSYSFCDLGDNGEYGCCPDGERCTGDGGTITQSDPVPIPSFTFTSYTSYYTSHYYSYGYETSSSYRNALTSTSERDTLSTASSSSDSEDSSTSTSSTDSSDSNATGIAGIDSDSSASASASSPTSTSLSGGGDEGSTGSGSNSGSNSGSGSADFGAPASGARSLLPRVAVVLGGLGAVVAGVLL